MRTVHFPENAEAALNRLIALHPGKTADQVIARAMCFYHTLYEGSLEGNTCECVNQVLTHLDGLDEQKNKEK